MSEGAKLWSNQNGMRGGTVTGGAGDAMMAYTKDAGNKIDN